MATQGCTGKRESAMPCVSQHSSTSGLLGSMTGDPGLVEQGTSTFANSRITSGKSFLPKLTERLPVPHRDMCGQGKDFSFRITADWKIFSLSGLFEQDSLFFS